MISRTIASLRALHAAALALGAVCLLFVVPAFARAQEKDKGKFSFAVYGDSRTMMYLPYKEGQEEKIHKQLVDVFALALGEKTAEAVVKKYVKLTFDPET